MHIQGVGIGLRQQHIDTILNQQPKVSWLEIMTDNHLSHQESPDTRLVQLREHYPMALHCLGMSIGSTDPLNMEYLKKVKNLKAQYEIEWVSDHLCWTSVQGQYTHELLPLPFTQEAIKHIVPRIEQIQAFFGERILIENVSSYLTFKHSEMTEAVFLSEIAKQADCHILLDVNNLYINAQNHDFDAKVYIDTLPKERVKQIHLAGFADMETHLLDTHGAEVCDDVWTLYAYAIEKLGQIPTLIERDNRIPEFSKLEKEALKAKAIMTSSFNKETIYATS